MFPKSRPKSSMEKCRIVHEINHPAIGSHPFLYGILQLCSKYRRSDLPNLPRRYLEHIGIPMKIYQYLFISIFIGKSSHVLRWSTENVVKTFGAWPPSSSLSAWPPSPRVLLSERWRKTYGSGEIMYIICMYIYIYIYYTYSLKWKGGDPGMMKPIHSPWFQFLVTERSL